ncbi:hypothetical protein G7Y89_g3140 [Cudoniella acicularis]|uniref:Endoplasmic reticulum junction formation protein lunapark n=1 Tax=Cudoniella acicularis TaxID=354080 RepID=A0A8H4W8P3_9HELO|nr:hypothetical protein G7Y89_g3140 [Cudoniella acicularis]
MVSLWPWKGDDTSPASFEKALSALATKISKSQTQLDALRQRGRRLKALWTLYASFAYLLCFIILFLVVGWKNWSATEYTTVSGSPLLYVHFKIKKQAILLTHSSIYLIRKGITAYYTFRVDTVTQRLEDQQAERTKTIDKLKAATKYDSTQELLEKYGGAPPASKPKKQKAPSKSPKAVQDQVQRVGTGPPPPTANISRSGQNQVPVPSQPSTPQQASNRVPPHLISSSPITPPQPVGPPEFAPNAFPASPQYANSGELAAEGHWYDRVLDLLLGEDETSPKNRVALICQNCRLVNGQAPPGTKSLAELGKWRCFGCGAWNGEEDEAAKVVQEIKERIEQDQPSSGNENVSDDPVIVDRDVIKQEDVDSAASDVVGNSEEDTIEVRPKKGRPKSNKKRS